MDKNTLVASGQALVAEMDRLGIAPRLAMWVHYTDRDIWKLWLVPPNGMTNKAEFYTQVSKIISSNDAGMGGLDSSDTEMILDTHPAVQGLKSFIRAPGLNNISFTGNRFNGFYLPDGIILRNEC